MKNIGPFLGAALGVIIGNIIWCLVVVLAKYLLN